MSVRPSLILSRSIRVVTNGKISLFLAANIPLCIHIKYITYICICMYIYVYIYTYTYIYMASPVEVENPPEMQETQVQSLGQKDALKAGVATHASILA